VATRLYFDTQTPTVSPTADGSWEVTGSMVRRWLDIGKFDLAGHALESLAVSTALNSPAGAVDALILQAVSPPLASNQTISGAIKGQIRALENSATADERMQCVIWVRTSAGAVRGTLIASSAAALSNEFNTALRNIKIPLGGSTVPTSVAGLTGDRIVVEIGYRKHENAATSRTGTFSAGNPTGSDLPEDETTTTALAGWIEFADNLTFSIAPVRVTQAIAQTAIVPTPAVRASQVVAQTAIVPSAVAVRASQVVMQVAISGAANAGSFTVNAEIQTSQGVTAAFSVDAWLQWHNDFNGFTIDAELFHTGFTIDAVVRRPMGKQFLLEATIGGVRITLDAVVRKTMAGLLRLDAWVGTGKTFTLDATVGNVGVLRGFLVAAQVANAVHGGSAPVDALCIQRFTASATLDAELGSGHRVSSFTVNADLKGQNEKRGTFTVNALVTQRMRGLFVLEWVVGGKGYFTLNAWLTNFTLNAQIGPKPITLDAQITRGFTINAEIVRLRFTADAVILRPGSVGDCWIDTFERTVANGLGGPWSLLETKEFTYSYSPARATVDGHIGSLAGTLNVAHGHDRTVETFYNSQYETYGGFPFLWSGTVQFDFMAPNINYVPQELYSLTVGSDQFYWIPYSTPVPPGSSAYWHFHSYVWDVFSPAVLLANDTWYTVKLEFNGFTPALPVGGYSPATAPTDRFKVWLKGDPEPAGWTSFPAKPSSRTTWPAPGIDYQSELRLGARWWIQWSGSTIIAEGSQRTRIDNFSMCPPVIAAATGFTVNAQIVSTTGTRASSFTVDAYVHTTGIQAFEFSVDAQIAVGAKSFSVNAQVGRSFRVDAFVRPYFRLDAYIRGNATIVYPPDGGPPVDPDGNPWPDWFKASRKYRIRITVGGVDVTGDVNFAKSQFTQNAKTGAGTFEMLLYGVQTFDGGEEVHVEIDDFRTFGGYVMSVEAVYIFEADATWTGTVLRGTDFNVLFDRLFAYNKPSVTGSGGRYVNWKSFAKGTYDDTIIKKVFGSYVDLPPGFDYLSYVDRVGVAAIEEPWAMPTAGSSVRQTMASLSQVTTSVWWIDPYLALHNHPRTKLTAPYPITDGQGGISSKELAISADISQMVNENVVWGVLARNIDGEITAQHDRDDDSISRYGRWQYGEFRSDLHHPNYIARRAQSILDRYQDPIFRAKAIIFEPGYQAGQAAHVISNEHGLDEILVIRQMTLTMAVAKERSGTTYYGVPRYELQLGLDPESPWDIYDFLPFPRFDPGGDPPWKRVIIGTTVSPVFDATKDRHYFFGTFTYPSDHAGSSDGVGGATLYADCNRPNAYFPPGSHWTYAVGMILAGGTPPDADYSPSFGIGHDEPGPGQVDHYAVQLLNNSDGTPPMTIGKSGTMNVGNHGGTWEAVSSAAAGRHQPKTVNVTFWFDPEGWDPPEPANGQSVFDIPFIDANDLSNRTFLTSYAYQPGSLTVFIDGIPVAAAETEPTVVLASGTYGRFVLENPLPTGAHITCTYVFGTGTYLLNDPEGEIYGAVVQGWGCETLEVVNHEITTTGLVTAGTLTLYTNDDNDSGRFLDPGTQWRSQQDGKHFTIFGGSTKVNACYRNFIVNAQSTMTSRIQPPNVQRGVKRIPW
jgi:hypothetical protein